MYKPPAPKMSKLEPPKPQGPLDVDAMVIPTMQANAGANQMSEYPEDDDSNNNNTKLEQLNVEQRK